VYTAKFVDLGAFAGLVAFSIAAVKAFLVMGVFMGLKYETKLNRLIFGAGFFFLALLAFFCVIDIWTRLHQASSL
jgi:caa(3)-type oxidase subunit IV